MITIREVHDLPPEWPGERNVQILAELSAGLFIWASTATAFIRTGYDPVTQLDILMASDSHHKGGFSLDHLYATALRGSGKWGSGTFTEDFRDILGATILGRVPLTDVTMDGILGLERNRLSKLILRHLRCLLRWDPGQPVRTLHASLTDYLTDSNRCGSDPWFLYFIFLFHNYCLLGRRPMSDITCSDFV